MFGRPCENRFETKPPGPEGCDRYLIKHRIGIRPRNGRPQKSATRVNGDDITVIDQIGVDAVGQDAGSLPGNGGSFTIYSQEGAL
jgi:hypothetical protein